MENSKRTIYRGNRPFITREILRTGYGKYLKNIITHRSFNGMVIASNPIRLHGSTTPCMAELERRRLPKPKTRHFHN